MRYERLASPVAEDIDDRAVGIPHEEPADAPRLIREPMNDLVAELLRRSVSGVDVVDLDRRVGYDIRGGVLTNRADLRRTVARVSEGDDPPLVQHDLHPKHSGVERSGTGRVVGLKIRNNALHRHDRERNANLHGSIA